MNFSTWNVPKMKGHIAACGASFRAAANRPEDGEHHGDRDDPGEETVPEFDKRVVFERGDELVLFAGRPVRTAEAGTGEPDGRPGDHDDGQRPECASGELDVALRRNRTTEHAQDVRASWLELPKRP